LGQDQRVRAVGRSHHTTLLGSPPALASSPRMVPTILPSVSELVALDLIPPARQGPEAAPTPTVDLTKPIWHWMCPDRVVMARARGPGSTVDSVDCYLSRCVEATNTRSA
jgi:hypothetical protein